MATGIGFRAAAVVVGCAAFLAGCSREAPKPPTPPPIAVSALTIAARDIPVTAVFVAQTQSSQAVNIQARVSGFLDKRVYVEGSVVKAGQVLFQMDPKPFQVQVDGAKAALQRNQAAADVAKANLARTTPLVQQNALSQKDLDDAKGQYEQAEAAVEQAKAQLEGAELNLSYTTIRSPVAGVASFAQVADGTYVSPQNAQLTTVSVLSPMYVSFSVSENQLDRLRDDVRAGRLRVPEGGRFTVEVELADGSVYPHNGKITFAAPSFSSSTGTFQLRATVDNPDGLLRPNQYVRVRLLGAVSPNAIVVPQSAVQQGAKGHFVWVIGAQDHAEQRPVVVGDWYGGDGWIVSDGLAAGDVVVVDGGLKLTPGAAVKSTPWIPAIAAPAAAKPVTAAPPIVGAPGTRAAPSPGTASPTGPATPDSGTAPASKGTAR